jgi:hypothetical protein
MKARIEFLREGDVVLKAEEAAGLARVLKHSILPRSLDSALRKLGIEPEGIAESA